MPSHSGITGNEVVDGLMKILAPNSYEMDPLSFVGSHDRVELSIDDVSVCLTPRFGIQNSAKENGTRKYRRIFQRSVGTSR